VRGEYDVTPDHQPILGRVDDGVFVAAGFSGHGFMIAPAVARILAALCSMTNAIRRSRFSTPPFRRESPCAEPQLV